VFGSQINNSKIDVKYMDLSLHEVFGDIDVRST